MRQIHETQIEITEVKFDLEYIQSKFRMLNSRDKPEEFTQKAFDSPHPDLLEARQKIRDRFVEIIDLPEMPEDRGEMKDRFYLTKIQFNPDDGKLKFDVMFKTPAFAKPVKMGTDWSNDFALETYSDFLQEIKLFITKQKRAQSDMFAGGNSSSESEPASERKQLRSGRELPEHQQPALAN